MAGEVSGPHHSGSGPRVIFVDQNQNVLVAINTYVINKNSVSIRRRVRGCDKRACVQACTVRYGAE